MILYGSNLGHANAHATTNMPTLFGGGGFKHGQHLEYRFASSTGTMRGLEMFQLTVKAPQIAYLRSSGPRSGEFLAVDELRFLPLSNSTPEKCAVIE